MMRKGLLFRLVRWSRAVRIFFGGYTKMEEKHYMYDLPQLLHVDDIRKALIPLCFQYNAFSSTYKKQIWTCRRLDPDGVHQYHLRFYLLDGIKGIMKVSGHWEIDPLISPSQHLAGQDLRALTEEEKDEIWNALMLGSR